MIGIIGAMPEEIEQVLLLMEESTALEHATRTFYQGTINGHYVVVVLAGIGKVNAAITTTLLLEQFDVDVVINIGVAGGQNNTKHLDIVVSKSVLYHDVDVTYFGSYKKGQIPSENPEFEANEELLHASIEVLDSLEFSYKVGRIASGDQFVYDLDMVYDINQEYDDIYAIEMEAAAIGHTCHLYKVPFIVFRSISDVLGEKNQQEDFSSFLAKASNQVTTLLIALLDYIE